MLNAIQIEFIVLKRYLLQIFGLALVVAAFLTLGMDSTATAPGMVMTMVGMSGGLTSGAYDEQGGWGPFRLTTPLSRRDVVIARYATTAMTMLVGAVAGMVVVCGLWGLSQLVELPQAMDAVLGMDTDAWATLAATFIACLAIVAVVTGVAIPLMFKNGSTAAQFAPIYVLLVCIGIGGGLGVLGVDLEAAFVAFKTWSVVPGNAALLACGTFAAAFAIWAISAAVSLKLYAARDL